MDDLITCTTSAKKYKADMLPQCQHVIRIYSCSSDVANLQIRSQGWIYDSGTLKYQVISNAYLHVEEATALRDSLNKWLDSQGSVPMPLDKEHHD